MKYTFFQKGERRIRLHGTRRKKERLYLGMNNLIDRVLHQQMSFASRLDKSTKQNRRYIKEWPVHQYYLVSFKNFLASFEITFAPRMGKMHGLPSSHDKYGGYAGVSLSPELNTTIIFLSSDSNHICVSFLGDKLEISLYYAAAFFYVENLTMRENYFTLILPAWDNLLQGVVQ